MATQAGIPPKLIESLLHAQPGGALPPDGGGGMPPGPADPSQQAAPPDPQGAMEQAVWSAFPGTDPSVVAQIASSPDAMSALFQLFDSDRAKLDEMHKAQLDAIVSHLMTPAPGMDMSNVSSPQVGGEGLVH